MVVKVRNSLRGKVHTTMKICNVDPYHVNMFLGLIQDMKQGLCKTLSFSTDNSRGK